MKYTLRHLEIFLAVARHKNTTAAAEELHLSQSAVSAALLALEKSYDVRLFDRTGKKLELNQTGHALRKKAESLLAHAREFDLELARHQNIGHLKVGASFTIGNHLAVSCLAAYLGEYPEAQVEFAVANSPEIIAKVLNYEVDVGMVENASPRQDLELIPWLEDELVVFCSPDHPLAKKRGALTEKDIAGVRWILREPESGARKTFENAFAPLLPKLNVYLEFKHNEAIKKAVEAGLGVGCLSQIVLQSNLKEGSLIPLQLSGRFRLNRTFYLALAANRYHKSATDNWLRVCQQL
ncbi:MAG: LysR substrate-binding domain-containing protein [Pseudomonadota bacterium]|nr:LysR substrate-binding domain-containing protein [Pseudomonadota bacterium]